MIMNVPSAPDAIRRPYAGVLGVCLAASLWASACSDPELAGSNFRCNSDADCYVEEVCGPVEEELACRPRSESPLRIGMSAPLQGPSRDLGNEMRRGINALFSRVNEDRGGVFSRKLELVCLNDNYDPDTARQVTEQLLDVRARNEHLDQPDVRGNDSVFALLGSVGTPTMLATAPLATKNRVLFFAPFTGAQTYLRDGTHSPYVYNYRAGYYDEAEAIVDYLASARLPRIISDPARDHRRLLVFAQEDSYGDAGYAGIVSAYNRRIGPLPSSDAIARVGYLREDVESVDPAIARTEQFLLDLLGDGTVRQSAAIVMVDTYQPGSKLIRGVKDWLNQDATRARQLDVLFIHVSFVGSDSLALSLTSPPESYPDVTATDDSTRASYAQGVMVTQVVPSYTSQAPTVAEYRADIERFDGGAFSFTSLEGYIVAGLFVTALELNGPTLTTDGVRQVLETELDQLDVGIGTRLELSADDHQASDTVWLSEIQRNGSFAVPFVWNPIQRILPN